MTRHIYVLLAVIVMVALPLFAGWFPFVGEMLPKIFALGYIIVFCPKLMNSKAFYALCLFYLYVVLQGIFYQRVAPIEWFANFMDYAIPIFLLQTLIITSKEKDLKVVGIFSIIYTFVTIILSLIVMFRDPTALRMQQAYTIMRELDLSYAYKKAGLASYGIAAMIMIMPVILIDYCKHTSFTNDKRLCIVGILLCLVFMWKGQVTTTLLICVAMFVMSFFLKEKSMSSIFFGALIIYLIVEVFGGALVEMILPYTKGTAMEFKFMNFDSMARTGEVYDEVGSVQGRAEHLKMTWNCFTQSPLYGNPDAYIGGHNFLVDKLGLFGIIGASLYYYLVYQILKIATILIPSRKRNLYLLICMGFIALGLLKNMPGIDYWVYIACFYPAIISFFYYRTYET